MANVVLDSRLVIRNDTSSKWTTTNPILLKGEMGIENDTGKFKFGDGAKNWNDLDYASAQAAVVDTKPPTETDIDYDIGTVWVDTNGLKSYILLKIVTVASEDGSNRTIAEWQQVLTPSDINSLGIMLKSDFATNSKSDSGYVDNAISADTIKNSTSGQTGSLSVNDAVTGADQTTNNGLWTANKIKTELDKKGDITGLDASRAVVTDENGKLTTSNVTSTEIGYLSGVTGGIQAQLDNIPKYNYLSGVSISIADGSTQAQIDTAVITLLGTTYPDAVKWNAVTVGIDFTPSDIHKDAIYYFNGTAWVFLNYVTTGIQRANGTTAGIVENSDDITFLDGQGTVVQAGKVKHSLTIGTKKFDGSSDISIASTDLSGLIPIATESTIGGIKSSSAVNQISVDSDGLMSLNTIGVAKLVLNNDTLVLNGGNA